MLQEFVDEFGMIKQQTADFLPCVEGFFLLFAGITNRLGVITDLELITRHEVMVNRQ
jgi:hypothetical protein